MLFKPDNLPDVRRFVDLWRNLADKEGLKGLHIVGHHSGNWPGHQWGFDGVTFAHQSILKWVHRKNRIRPRLRRAIGLPPHVYRYEDSIPYMHGPKYPDYEMRDDHYPSIVPGWDNSPRAGKAAMILTGATPELFRRHVRFVLDRVKHKPLEHRIVFLKSWNEWAEGNYMEPDIKYGRAFLEVLREEVASERPAPAVSETPALERVHEA
jgi:hypothetical protein